MTKIIGTHATLIIADDIPEFVPSPEILTLKTKMGFLLTKHPKHEDYSVWFKGRIIAQGGRALTERIFEERAK